MRLRLRTESAAAPRQNGGRRFFPKLWTGQRSPQSNASYSDAVDGHQPPQREETPPQQEIFTFRQRLDAQQFSEASQLLIDREAVLFGDSSEAEPLRDHEEEVARLADDYGELEGCVWKTLDLSLSAEGSKTALASAVRAVYQEEARDRWWQQSSRTRPGWRPGNWEKLHDKTLRNLVQRRMDAPSTAPTDPANHPEITAMVRQLKEDLLLVVEDVRSCYPPEADICNFYAGLYHQCLSTRLKEKAEPDLNEEDCKTILLWVNNYYPGILKKPELASHIDSQALGNLLSKNSLERLERKFLSKKKDELKTYISRVLDEENEKWIKGEEPSMEDDCYVSHEVFVIIQFVDGIVRAVETVVGDRHKAHDLTGQLNDFMQTRKTFQSDIIKQNKANSRPFIKANLNFIEQFSLVLEKQTNLFSKEMHKNFEQLLPDMRQSAHAYLLKPVHEALKQHYRKLGTSEWLNQQLFEPLLDTITHEFQDVKGSTDSCHQKLVCQMHRDVAVEYVKRLLKGGLKLKDQSLQLEAYNKIKDDAENLHDFFIGMGSNEGWLKDVLINIAEVLKLQDFSTIQLHVVLMANSFPDLSVKHVSALLKLKTNLSKKDRNKIKDTLSETLAEVTAADTPSFFSKVQIK